MDTNLSVNVAKQMVEAWPKRLRRIGNISSVNGQKGSLVKPATRLSGMWLYQALAQELASKGVTVNTVSLVVGRIWCEPYAVC